MGGPSTFNYLHSNLVASRAPLSICLKLNEHQAMRSLFVANIMDLFNMF